MFLTKAQMEATAQASAAAFKSGEGDRCWLESESPRQEANVELSIYDPIGDLWWKASIAPNGEVEFLGGNCARADGAPGRRAAFPPQDRPSGEERKPCPECGRLIGRNHDTFRPHHNPPELIAKLGRKWCDGWSSNFDAAEAGDGI